MIIIAYFFLICPGEYMVSNQRAPRSASKTLTSVADVASLRWGSQPRRMATGKIENKASGDPLLFPKVGLLWRVLHLRSHGDPSSTPLYRVMTPVGSRKKITSTMISKTLKTAIGFYGPNLGFKAKDVSARSLRTSGAMELLWSGLDINIIKLIGRWCSNEMLRYLHVQEGPLMTSFSRIMLTHGNYSFLPHQEEVLCF